MLGKTRRSRTVPQGTGKPRIVHQVTAVQSTFAVIDGDGNAIPQQPVTVQIHKLTPEAFAEAHDLIVQARDNATIEE